MVEMNQTLKTKCHILVAVDVNILDILHPVNKSLLCTTQLVPNGEHVNRKSINPVMSVIEAVMTLILITESLKK